MSLIHLSQIKDGLLLKSELEALKAKYDAAKVLTDLVKPARVEGEALIPDVDGKLLTVNYPVVEDIHNKIVLYADGVKVEPSEYEFNKETGEFTGKLEGTNYTVDYSFYDDENEQVYNVNELIKSINTVIDEQLGGGSGSIDERIKAAVDSINNRVVRDYVKITGSYTPGETEPTIDWHSELSQLVIDKSVDYVVYGLNNRALQKEDGTALTYNFETNTFNGVLSKVSDEDKNIEDGVDYVPVDNLTEFKMFLIADFTFNSLGEDYLLDNREFNAASYSQAIDELVVHLRQDSDLIESIKKLVGEESVKEQIEKITKALDERIEVVEDAVAILNGADTVEGSVDKKIKDAIEALKAVVDFNLQSKYVELYNADQDIFQEIKKLKAIREVSFELETVEEAQAEFTLPDSPVAEHKVRLFINGAGYREDKHFTVDRANKIVAWSFSEENGGFNMETDFDLEFVYKVEDEVEEPTYLTPPAEPIAPPVTEPEVPEVPEAPEETEGESEKSETPPVTEEENPEETPEP